MKKGLTPDFMFKTFEDVTPAFLLGQGITVLLSDIDNTLAPYECEVPDKRIVDWVNLLRDSGIRLALISNNCRERVELFNKSLGLPSYPNSRKPLTVVLKKVLLEMGGSKENTAVLGDQLLTDVLAGRALGLRTLVVPPIKDKKNLFFKLKRAIEKPFIVKYLKKHGYTAKQAE